MSEHERVKGNTMSTGITGEGCRWLTGTNLGKQAKILAVQLVVMAIQLVNRKPPFPIDFPSGRLAKLADVGEERAWILHVLQAPLADVELWNLAWWNVSMFPEGTHHIPQDKERST
jgi:hypothetical protein